MFDLSGLGAAWRRAVSIYKQCGDSPRFLVRPKWILADNQVILVIELGCLVQTGISIYLGCEVGKNRYS